MRTLVVLFLAAVTAGCIDNPLTSEPMPQSFEDNRLPGGETTNTFLFGVNAFSRHVENATDESEPLFFSGNSFFNLPWVIAPASTTARDGLGPTFNARSCDACHFKDGRGNPIGDDGPGLGLLIRVAGDDHKPHPVYGGQIQPFGIPGVPAEARLSVTYEDQTLQYPDGETYLKRTPTYAFSDWAFGEPNIRISPRVAPQMIGLGLLEAIPEERLRELADPDDQNNDGISGRISDLGDRGVGRFGWKAQQQTVESQSAGAFLGDMGLTTTLNPTNNCPPEQVACLEAENGGEPEISARILERVVAYSMLLAVPERRGAAEDLLPGRRLFHQVGCANCHTPKHVTGTSRFSELEHQTIWPYTDMLLHDMGDELADEIDLDNATRREWRTPPLWGIGLFKTVNKHTRLMHDGRADGVAEAIMWHGGEGKSSRDKFAELSASEREELIRFVRAL